MTAASRPGPARAELRRLIDDARLRLQQYHELWHYAALPEDWQPIGITRVLVDSALSLLASLTPEDAALERLIVDLYDARHSPFNDFGRELDRLRRALHLTGQQTPASEWLRHMATVPIALPVTVDYYGWPVVRIGAAGGNAHYWHLGRSAGRVDIGLSAAGRLREIEIVSYCGLLPQVDEKTLSTAPAHERGVPVFSLEPWNDLGDASLAHHFVDGAFGLELRADSLVVRLSPDDSSYRVAVADRLECGFNLNGELCAISIQRLSSRETARMRALHETTA